VDDVPIATALKRYWLSILVSLVVLAALSTPYMSTGAVQHLTRTYTSLETRISSTTYQGVYTWTWDVGACGSTNCPIVEKSSAFLSTEDNALILLDVTLYNPTSLQVRNIVVRFDYWKPSSCSTCPPDFTTRVQFDAVNSGERVTKRIEIRQDIFRSGRFQQIRYTVLIETYVSSVVTAQLPVVMSSTVLTEQLSTAKRLVAPYEVILPDAGQWSVSVPAVSAIAVFSALAIITRSMGRSSRRWQTGTGKRIETSSSSIKTDMNTPTDHLSALDAGFRKYRDRLQEKLFSGEIDEDEYARRLEEFIGVRKEARK